VIVSGDRGVRFTAGFARFELEMAGAWNVAFDTDGPWRDTMLDAMKKTAKRAVRQVFESRGLMISPQAATNGTPLPFLKILVGHGVAKHGAGAILQIGANDGLMDDPIHEVVVELKLPALLVEPLPDMFEQLKRNYEGHPDIRFENCAIGGRGGIADLYRVKGDATHLPFWARGLASFNEAVILKNGIPKKYFEKVSVPVLTIRQLLSKHDDIRRFLVLQVDVEGHDFIVVKSAVEAGLLPPIINYEHQHLSLSDQFACRELLSVNGYSFSSNTTDTIAYKA
jgi:FkbM family methyltransferase